ncbi:phage holin family protein [Microbacterium gorillae]|uniref:phage holin family protein n=1 Tax=Microbacterium gorillae TaxID=1231063 RepID=UPI00058F7943|nr:phage holin family protein [Microbacterium gorillae]
MTTPRGFRDRADDGLLSLVGEVPELVRNLVVAEVNAGKDWLTRVAKDAGMGVGWFFGALFFLFWAIPSLGTFFIAGLASWMPVWLSALLVFVIMLLIAGVLALLGVSRMKKIAKSENPVKAAKTDAVIVKEVADEF